MSFRAFTANVAQGLPPALLFLTIAPVFAAEPGMVFVPAGEFARGRSHQHKDAELPYYPNPLRDDLPVRKIYVDAFYMDEAEVTNERYAAFLKATRHPAPYHWKKSEMPTGKGKLPVVNVTYDDAVAFCAWEAKRLPTEAEWERACRGVAEGQMTPWGNTDVNAKQAHFNAQDAEAVCGDRVRNYFGLCDMIGNVWEWTADWYGQKYYEAAPERNPPGPTEGMYRVLRGGSWFDQPGSLQFLTCSYRSWTRPGERSPTIGFRCAKSLRARPRNTEKP